MEPFWRPVPAGWEFLPKIGGEMVKCPAKWLVLDSVVWELFSFSQIVGYGYNSAVSFCWEWFERLVQ